MNAQRIALENEEKDKKKSRVIAFFFFLSFAAVAFLPLLSMIQPEEPQYESVVTIDFSETKFEKASKKAADSGAKGGEKAPPKTEKVPVPEVKPLPPKPPVVTTHTPAPPVPMPPKKTPPPPVPTKTSHVPAPPIPVPPKTPVPTTPTEAKSDAPTETNTNKKESGAGNGAGKSGDGKASTSSDGDDVTPGEGDEGMDFSGNGIFGRRVVYRADVKKITQEEGKIVVNLCVGRTGRVVYAENNEELSTITNPSIVKKAVDCAKRYRFDKDYTAAEKECGKLTFIFDLND